MEEKTFPFEIKSVTEEGTFEGYAAIFGTPDALGEVIDPRAFNKTLKEGKTRPMCWYHDVREPMGIVELSVDEKGLRVKGEFDLNVQIAREKHSMMKKKIIRGLSFGFKTIKDVWEGTSRILKEIKLFEVSPVTFHAHPDALVMSVKQWDEEKPYPNEHSARIKSPNLFDPKTFRRTPDGTIYGKIKVPATAAVLWAKLKDHNKPDDNPIPQSIRFPTKDWTAAAAKKWLADNNVKYEKFEPAAKSLEGVLDTLLELKSGGGISAENMKLHDAAIRALQALIDTDEPQKSTPDGEKSLLSPVFEALEKPLNADKPQEHLLGPVFEALENPTKE